MERIKGVIGVEIIKGQVVVMLPKAVLVVTKQQVIQALRRGKAWRRRQSLARWQAVHGADGPHMLTTVRYRQAQVERRMHQRRPGYLAL